MFDLKSHVERELEIAGYIGEELDEDVQKMADSVRTITDALSQIPDEDKGFAMGMVEQLVQGFALTEIYGSADEWTDIEGQENVQKNIRDCRVFNINGKPVQHGAKVFVKDGEEFVTPESSIEIESFPFMPESKFFLVKGDETSEETVSEEENLDLFEDAEILEEEVVSEDA